MNFHEPPPRRSQRLLSQLPPKTPSEAAAGTAPKLPLLLTCWCSAFDPSYLSRLPLGSLNHTWPALVALKWATRLLEPRRVQPLSHFQKPLSLGSMPKTSALP